MASNPPAELGNAESMPLLCPSKTLEFPTFPVGGTLPHTPIDVVPFYIGVGRTCQTMSYRIEVS